MLLSSKNNMKKTPGSMREDLRLHLNSHLFFKKNLDSNFRHKFVTSDAQVFANIPIECPEIASDVKIRWKLQACLKSTQISVKKHGFVKYYKISRSLRQICYILVLKRFSSQNGAICQNHSISNFTRKAGDERMVFLALYKFEPKNIL